MFVLLFLVYSNSLRPQIAKLCGCSFPILPPARGCASGAAGTRQQKEFPASFHRKRARRCRYNSISIYLYTYIYIYTHIVDIYIYIYIHICVLPSAAIRRHGARACASACRAILYIYECTIMCVYIYNCVFLSLPLSLYIYIYTYNIVYDNNKKHYYQ